MGVMEPLSLLKSEAEIWMRLPSLPVLRALVLELQVLQYKLILLAEGSCCEGSRHEGCHHEGSCHKKRSRIVLC